MGQRLLVLATKELIDVGSGIFQVSVTAPPTAKIAPPSFYLLFVVYRQVPSPGTWVQIGWYMPFFFFLFFRTILWIKIVKIHYVFFAYIVQNIRILPRTVRILVWKRKILFCTKISVLDFLDYATQERRWDWIVKKL